jgi:hypothetical protein
MKGVTRLPEQPCPVCGKTLDCAGTFDKTDDAPSPGDWTVCSGCFGWLAYEGPFMALRGVTNAEWLALSDNDRVELTRRVATVRAAWGKP